MKYKEISELLKLLLELDTVPIGIKFLTDKNLYEQMSFPEFPKKLPYCVIVKQSFQGTNTKFKFENLGCLGGARALGLMNLDDYYMSGRMFADLHLYRDLGIAKKTVNAMALIKEKIYGIAVGPLEAFQEEIADIILLLTTPYFGMRAVQAYTFMFGTNTEYRFSGNQAVCSECTAYPHLYQRMNISLLCSGTRAKAGWKEDQLMIGLPASQAENLVKGLMDTVNPMSVDRYKEKIKEGLERMGISKEIIMGKNYFSGLYDKDRKKLEESCS